ncbi:hypothetical protein SERLA73DRAFT_182241 [Serpula lacrymans var. lacrymans S7.3]|uniref:Uncharacterized protein n=2 Tax=Serpula lacrymans var. lacrymans TaxID=341189 RepID=F8PWY4_SERL3|nr:uncharacterized protein SERLADRAFT_468798 [Serpula lacrymans var. lacrymans S7.9]EGN99311.1 hypothetical protein SERLA73DRAFT_182241 [Serpula lacrymans var. lacrymans S7.3]EGO24875.1 hypothetical protein SERLADRAFT_468798 [Serpula lacrymans var. lacrymans S7.9]
MTTKGSAGAGFITIGDGVYLSVHQRASVSAPNGITNTTIVPAISPDVIIIFGWMGAQLRHLYNYTREYAKLFPSATRILVRCHPSFFWSSQKSKHTRLFPVVEALEALGCIQYNTLTKETAPLQYDQPRILTHVFSNGGSLQLVTLNQVLSKRVPQVNAISFTSVIIFDSCPAVGTFRTLGLAFTLSIRSRLLRISALTFVYTLYILTRLRYLLFGTKILMEQLRESLFNPQILPWTNSRTPRLYLYSRKDELVPWQQVQNHSEVSRSKGLNVRTELFENSAHVAHMRAEPDRYWSSVMKIWNDACVPVESE